MREWQLSKESFFTHGRPMIEDFLRNIADRLPA
jgi:hypothetical protein